MPRRGLVLRRDLAPRPARPTVSDSRSALHSLVPGLRWITGYGDGRREAEAYSVPSFVLFGSAAAFVYAAGSLVPQVDILVTHCVFSVFLSFV